LHGQKLTGSILIAFKQLVI